jgi:uncharacterized protein (DUF58 family)
MAHPGPVLLPSAKTIAPAAGQNGLGSAAVRTHSSQERQQLARRHAALAKMQRERLGLWRRLGRSNRLFPRKLVVTLEGKWIIAIAILLGAAAVNTGNNLLYLLLSLVISVIAVSGILSELCLRDLQLERCYPAEIEVGEAAPLRVAVRNPKSRAALHIEAGELVDATEDADVKMGYLLHLAGFETGQAFGAIRAKRRGPIRTVGLSLGTAYPFGFAKKSRLFDDPAEFLALPAVANVQLPWQGALDRFGAEQSPKTGQGDAFAGLRDAREGDSLRDIHWKVSARRQRLIAREWQAETRRVALVRFVHVAPTDSADPQHLDAACSTVAGLCARLLEDGFAVGLQTLQGAVPAEADVGNRDQLTRIRRHLAWLLPADRPVLPAWPLDDADWLVASAHARTCTEALTARQPLPWGGQVVTGTAEMYLVQFAHRTDVLTAGHVDAHVLLDTHGKVLRIERAQTLRAA